MLLYSLTPSFVHVQLVQGEIFLDDPNEMSSPFTRHWVTSSLQWLKSISGKDLHGTRGLLKGKDKIAENYLEIKISSFNFPMITKKNCLIRGQTYRNSWGWSKMDFWISPTMSQFSQTTFDRVNFRISFNWASLKRVDAASFSYQWRSHFLSFWNWIPMIQAKVGPTNAPCNGVSLKPPVNRSISSTLWYTYISKIQFI